MLVFINSTDSMNFNIFSLLSKKDYMIFFWRRVKIASEATKIDLNSKCSICSSIDASTHQFFSAAIPWKVIAIYIQLSSDVLYLLSIDHFNEW